MSNHSHTQQVSNIIIHKTVPDDMVLEALTRRLNQLDCATKGWVLHGFPLTRDQAEGLSKAGHHPNRYAMWI